MPIRATFPDGSVTEWRFAEEAAQPFDLRFLDGRIVRCRIASPVGVTAPTATAVDTLAGRVFTLVVSASGTQPLTFSLTLTANGSSVTATESGTGSTRTYTYTVPSSASATALAWVATVSNTGGSAQVTGSRSVPADQTPAQIVSVTFDVGGALIEYTGNLTDAFDVAGILVEAS